MPAKSQAQRSYLNAKFGHAWVKKHGFDNAGPLPGHVADKDPVQVAKPLPMAKAKKRKARGKKGEDGKGHPKHHFTMHNTKHH